MLSTVSIIPGMENLPPERQDTSSGLSGIPEGLAGDLLQHLHGVNFLLPHAGGENCDRSP